jgi:hypothetical protein
VLIATIVHYYENRRQYLGRIVDALQGGSVAPDQIVVWNNSSRVLDPIYGCSMIEADKNYGPFTRYGAALIAANQVNGSRVMSFGTEPIYCFFQDDDLLVGEQSLEQLRDGLTATDMIVGPMGQNLSADPVRPYDTAIGVAEGEADIIISRLLMCHPQVIGAMLAWVTENGIIDVHREDDLVLCMSNKARGGHNRVVPCDFTSLDEGGAGMSHDPEHYRLRDKACLLMKGMAA